MAVVACSARLVRVSGPWTDRQLLRLEPRDGLRAAVRLARQRLLAERVAAHDAVDELREPVVVRRAASGTIARTCVMSWYASLRPIAYIMSFSVTACGN